MSWQRCQSKSWPSSPSCIRTRVESAEPHVRWLEELTANDALAAHLEVELNIDQDDIVSPWRAAYTSAVAFLIGGLLPVLSMRSSLPAAIAPCQLLSQFSSLWRSPAQPAATSAAVPHYGRLFGCYWRRARARRRPSSLRLLLPVLAEAAQCRAIRSRCTAQATAINHPTARGVRPRPVQPEFQFSSSASARSVPAVTRDPDSGSQRSYGLNCRIQPTRSAGSPVSQDQVVHQAAARLACHRGDSQVIVSTAEARSQAGSPRPPLLQIQEADPQGRLYPRP